MAQTIGFIGLGIMGRPMAKNLLQGRLPAHRAQSQSCGRSTSSFRPGPRPPPSPREVAAQSDVLITMLPNSPDVELVALGKDGVIEGARPGLIFVDMSTISPLVSQKVGAGLGANVASGCSTPRLGWREGCDRRRALDHGRAASERLRAMSGPSFRPWARPSPSLALWASDGFTKLANQIIVAVNLTALGEALTLARKAGLDRELTLKALAGGLAGSRCLDQKTPNYVSGTYNPGFKIDLHFKDLGLIMESARALGVPLPATAVVQELFSALRVKGRGGLDHSGVITLLEDLAGLSA